MYYGGYAPDTPAEKRLNLIGLGLFCLFYGILFIYACLPDDKVKQKQLAEERAFEERIKEYSRQNSGPPPQRGMPSPANR